jgi:transcription elongation factor SPT6
MMNAVNDAGVDLNMACEKEHMRGLLQFVAGLGPRKAAALRTGISQV